VSYLPLLRFVLLYGLFFASVQFVFAQALGVYGERAAADLWAKEVRGRNPLETFISGLLFTHGDYVVRADKAWPALERAEGVQVYRLSGDGLHIEAAYTAGSAVSGPAGWELREVESVRPREFSFESAGTLLLPIGQRLSSFRTFQRGTRISAMDILVLRETINRLESASTNVEALKAAYHKRFAYAGSIAVMGLLGLAISLGREKIYVSVFLALLCIFAFFVIHSFLSALGEKGILPPPLAAWSANAVFAVFAALYVFFQYPHIPRRRGGAAGLPAALEERRV
jgi:lipopolysaccharide export system permease protein